MNIQEGSLGPLNALVEQAWASRTTTGQTKMNPGFLHESAWDTWLWGEDPLEEAPVTTMLNRMHLLGLLIAR